MATIQATVVRTKMVGGGTSYDVYLPISAKQYRPIACGCYATVIVWRGGEYYELDEFLRTRELDGLPALTDERLRAFRRVRRLAERLKAKIAARAFRELRGRKKLPTFWAQWTKPSKTATVPVVLNDRYCE